MRTVLPIIVFFAFSGCVSNTSNVDQTVQNLIAKCGAGISSGWSAELIADISADLKKGGELSASTQNGIRAAFLDLDGEIDSDTRTEMFNSYLSCIDNG